LRRMNEQSLQRVNAFLGAVAARTATGAVLEVTPAELGRDLGFPDPLSTARAVRALIARKRLEPAMGSYRLLDPTPVGADEKEAITRPRRRGQKATRAEGRGRLPSDRAAFSDLGRAVVDKLIDVGRENAQLRAELRTAREELRGLRVARDDAEHRARTHAEKHRELESRAEMAESNLRTLLASARGRETHASSEGPVSDSEMEAILGVLKANGETETALSERGSGSVGEQP
jgi:hypothetical protein